MRVVACPTPSDSWDTRSNPVAAIYQRRPHAISEIPRWLSSVKSLSGASRTQSSENHCKQSFRSSLAFRRGREAPNECQQYHKVFRVSSGLDVPRSLAGGYQKPHCLDAGGVLVLEIPGLRSRPRCWQELAPLPEAVTHIGTAYHEGRIYAVGGFETFVHMRARSAAFVYDVAVDEWTALPDLPIAAESPAVAAVGGKVHVIAGRDAETAIEVPLSDSGPMIQVAVGGTLTAHQVFDPETGKWTQAAALPDPPRDHIAVAVLDDRIHLLGGRVDDTDQNVAEHAVYDPRSDTWERAAPLPDARSAGAASAVDGKIVFVGGECRPGGEAFTPNAYDEAFEYDLASDSWTELPTLPGGRHGFGGATVGKTIYFPAGAPVCAGGALADMLSITLD